jgi:hypothetical protein
MRNPTWLTTAILLSGCAQGVPAGDPIADLAAGATSPASDAGSNPAPQPPWPCDPSIAAGEGVTIKDGGACPGLLPAAVSCAADLTICSGVGNPPGGGMSGNSAVGATSDGRGSVVLSCHRADVGPPLLNFLFVPTRSGFVSKAGLGVDVRPLGDGFVVSEGSYLPPPSYDFIAHDGNLRQGQRGGTLYASATRAVIVHPTNGEIIAQSFTAAGDLAATATLASSSADASSLMFGGAMNASGAALVIWQVYGESKATARWLALDGTPGAPPFSIAGWTSNVPDARALAGGSVAIAAEPPSGVSVRRWRGVIAPGESVERPAPAWLAARGDFLLLPEGKAMAFGTEILAGDGTVCGTVDLGAPLVGIGLDGTAFAARNQRTFRIYPQLFR